MIADVFNYAIAVIGFIQAVRRLFARKGFTASLNTVMTLNWLDGGINVEIGVCPLCPTFPE